MEYRLGASIAVGLGLNTDAAFRRIDVCNWDHTLVVEVQRAGVCLRGPTNIREDLNLTAQKSCQVTITSVFL